MGVRSIGVSLLVSWLAGCTTGEKIPPGVRIAMGGIEVRTNVAASPVQLQTPWAQSDAFNRAFNRSFSACLSGSGSGGYGPGAGGAALLILAVGATTASIDAANAEKHAKLDAQVQQQSSLIRSHVASLPLLASIHERATSQIRTVGSELHSTSSPSPVTHRLELVIREVGLRGVESADPEMRLYVKVSVTLLDAADSRQICKFDLQTESRLGETFEEWSRAPDATLQEQVNELFDRIARRIAEEILVFDPI